MIPSIKNIGVSLLILIVLKSINQFTTFQYTIYNRSKYHEVNKACQIKDAKHLKEVQDDPVMNLLHTGYLLSAFGSLLASKWASPRTVLTIGGGIMTLATGLMLLSYLLGLLCQQWFYTIVWLFHPLYMGLILPCLLFGFIHWTTGPRSRMVFAILFYCSSESSYLINLLLMPTIVKYIQHYSQKYTAIAGAILSLMFTALTIALHRDWRQASFELPTISRLVRYFQILTVLTLFAVQFYDGHVFVYRKEIALHSNSSDLTQDELNFLRTIERVNLPLWINVFAFFATSTALAVTGCCKRITLVSHEKRMQIGVVMAASVAIVCFIVDIILHRFGPTSLTLTTIFYCTAAFTDGVAEIFTMVAVYELVDIIGPRSHKLLLCGIALSIWTLSSFVRLFLKTVIIGVIFKSFSIPQTYSYCVTHALDFIMLVICFVYCRYVSFPLSFTLSQEEEEDTSDESVVEEPLFDPSNSGLVNEGGFD